MLLWAYALHLSGESAQEGSFDPKVAGTKQTHSLNYIYLGNDMVETQQLSEILFERQIANQGEIKVLQNKALDMISAKREIEGKLCRVRTRLQDAQLDIDIGLATKVDPKLAEIVVFFQDQLDGIEKQHQIVIEALQVQLETSEEIEKDMQLARALVKDAYSQNVDLAVEAARIALAELVVSLAAKLDLPPGQIDTPGIVNRMILTGTTIHKYIDRAQSDLKERLGDLT